MSFLVAGLQVEVLNASYQQVVGSNPTGGSNNNTKKYKALWSSFICCSVDCQIVRYQIGTRESGTSFY
jgi:hypothetical protein